MLGRNRIKYLTSLKIKKFRDEHNQFIIEGDKIVRDLLTGQSVAVCQLFATDEWLKQNETLFHDKIGEIVSTDAVNLKRISSFESHSPVAALLDIPRPLLPENPRGTLSIGLDNIQDPGNLGTIIRSADWFGIRNVFCSTGSADAYNPKVVQASMGAILNVAVHYTDLAALLKRYSEIPDFSIYGTFMKGIPVHNIQKPQQGLILFGNESRGISEELGSFIGSRITIPSYNSGKNHVESLNVATSVAIVLAFISH